LNERGHDGDPAIWLRELRRTNSAYPMWAGRSVPAAHAECTPRT
jgi:hypothetical protein